ncbi:MAG: TIGR02221 family CRISPR-associated protein [Alistipes sp.]|nr:TIGR02221 family CRISPR-associated protein [Alistipes sp.]
MAKVLISFLGTGQHTDDRKYREARYQFDSGDQVATSFVSLAIKQHCTVDKIFLIGTAHSMWEEVYRAFATPTTFDSNLHANLGVAIDDFTAHTPLDALDDYRDVIESAMGGGSKMVIVKYGLNEEEIAENASIILSLEEHLQNGDELIVDVTHSFRSLPLYILNLLIYLKNVSDKRINISHIYYGMLDYMRENQGIAPVVDLIPLLKLNDWITAAHNFSKFGNGYKIAELLRDEGDEVAATAVKNFSDVKNLNHLVAMQQQYNALTRYSKTNENWSVIANAVVPKVIERFRKKTFVEQENNAYSTSDFQFNIAKWHYEHLNFFAAYTNLSEAVVSRCAEFVLSYNGEQNELVDDYLFREAVKDYLKEDACNNEYDILNGWSRLWNDIAPCRNALAHAKRRAGEAMKAQMMIENFSEFEGRYPMLKQKQGTKICPVAIYNIVMVNYTERVEKRKKNKKNKKNKNKQ